MKTTTLAAVDLFWWKSEVKCVKCYSSLRILTFQRSGGEIEKKYLLSSFFVVLNPVMQICERSTEFVVRIHWFFFVWVSKFGNLRCIEMSIHLSELNDERGIRRISLHFSFFLVRQMQFHSFHVFVYRPMAWHYFQQMSLKIARTFSNNIYFREFSMFLLNLKLCKYCWG